MKTMTSIALASVIGLGLVSAVQAQETSLAPSVPNPANPYPLNPVASDGTPLPRFNGTGGLYTGRSAYAPVGGAIDAGAGIAGDAIGTGVGLADDAVGAGVALPKAWSAEPTHPIAELAGGAFHSAPPPDCGGSVIFVEQSKKIFAGSMRPFCRFVN